MKLKFIVLEGKSILDILELVSLDTLRLIVSDLKNTDNIAAYLHVINIASDIVRRKTILEIQNLDTITEDAHDFPVT
jgi:hypothetical protein